MKKNKSFLVQEVLDSLVQVLQTFNRKNFKVKVFDNNSRGHLKNLNKREKI